MKFSIFPNSQILILFFLLRPLARHLMPAIVASMSCASIRNQNVPYRTTRQRQNIHYSFKASAVQSMPKAKVHLSSIIYHLCRRQNIHYSLNFARPLRPLRPDNPDTLLSSFSGEYNSPLSSSRAQDFSFEVGFLGFLGFSGQDIGIFEDHRPFLVVLLQKSERDNLPRSENLKSNFTIYNLQSSM